jgi:hypothetical protein
LIYLLPEEFDSSGFLASNTVYAELIVAPRAGALKGCVLALNLSEISSFGFKTYFD